jgi:hypothetical protein
MRSKATLIFACAVLVSAAPAFGNELTNGRITAELATGGSKTMDRMDSITWINSDGVLSGNYVANGGPPDCGDPQEFFGESYSDSDSFILFMVVAGASAKWDQTNALTGTSKTTGKDTCFTLSGKTATTYSLDTDDTKMSQMTIKRTLTFTADANLNMRAYAARLPNAVYATVLYPDSTGAVQTVNLFNCGALPACEITDWNGKWFADDDGQGNGMVMIRDKASTWPALLGIDYDSFSSSNVTSMVLLRPSDGWIGKKVVETEHMCFYDAKSWPAKKRNAGKLPVGCTVKTP